MTSGIIRAFVRMAMHHSNLARLCLKRRSPASLQSLCLDQVAELLATTWSQAQTNDPQLKQVVDEVVKYLRLPGVFADEVMRRLLTEQIIHTGHLVVLLRLGLQTIRLDSEHASIHWPDVMTLVSQQALQVVSCLDVSGRIEHIPSAMLQKLLSSFAGIHELHLPYTLCDDNCLGIIAKHCPQLRFLDLTRCPVTDKGLDVLHEPQDLPHLERVCLKKTKVTCMGAAILLSHVPLQELVVDNMVDTLLIMQTQIHAQQQVDAESCVSNLRNLKVVRIEIHDKSCRHGRETYADMEPATKLSMCLDIISASCRVVEKVVVCNTPRLSGSIHGNDVLTHLELHFRSCENFFEVQSTLADVGKHLRELCLSNVDNLTVADLHETAPNVRALSLKNITGSNGVTQKNVIDFHRLQELSMCNCPLALVLGLISSTQKLQTLALTGISEFEPLDLQVVERYVRHCRQLSFCDCVGLTALRIERLLPEISTLEHLNVYGNSTLHSKMADLKHRLDKANVDLCITMKNVECFSDMSTKLYGSYVFD